MKEVLFGYAGQLLRIDLTRSSINTERLDESILKQYPGGATLGIKFIYDEVPPGVEWSNPENRLFLGTGPLTGTRICGSGSTAVVSKGPLTNGMASTQANGFFGAFLKFSGFDAIILQGAASDWSYIYIHDGIAEIKDAGFLLGKTTVEVESLLRSALGKKEKEVSVLSIGPAGENLVRFACISTDMGHMAAHNGVGAVMGSKKIKAIVVERTRNTVQLNNSELVTNIGKELLNIALNNIPKPHVEGTVGGILMGTATGSLCVRNYTSSINTMDPEILQTYSYQSVRSRFNAKPAPCWACPARHCHMMKIQEGKYAGREFEEPEYEGMAAFSSLVGIQDVTMSAVLASEVDRLGMDINESGWTIAWVLECYEKKILTRKDTDGLEMTWGNGEAILTMLNKIARREGFGNILAEGVMRASQNMGKESQKLAIHTQKGNTPRSHDHRAMWLELFDTCVSNTGTLEAHSVAPYKLLGIPIPIDSFNPEVIPVINAKIKGAMIFEDSMVTCRFNTNTNLELLSQAVNAATGWNINISDAMIIGKRAVNLARIFNLRHGIKAELDAPSIRYGSTPLDGLVAGRGILPHWDKMLRTYYRMMGWDENTGKPLPETLINLGLDDVIAKL
ncbi:MAG: aldehyde ferredoxin oxidoreductase C-terminal domain-containing protein [bacterium]|nr:aldehyde ferredoxin oxidoreductase C-terminal domain-containing protein [bacterium]